MPKSLQELLRDIEYRLLKGALQIPISGLAYDSRKVQPGELFVALPGTQTDGHLFLEEALRRGASAVSIQAGRENLLPAQAHTAVSVPEAYLALAAISVNFYDHPALALKLSGVTGTKGKSTTAYLINSIHKAAGFKRGLVGTIAYELMEESRPAPHTTPEAPDLQALLAEMRDRNITHVAMEVSSHALAQHRADGCHFSAAVFTNLSRDHLDFHLTEENYLAAKLRLFSDPGFLPPGGKRGDIINADDAAAEKVSAAAVGKVITFGIDAKAQIRAEELRLTPSETAFTLQTPWGKARLRLNLLGRFNIYNALAAAGAALAEGISLEVVCSALQAVEPPAGRFQHIPSETCTVIVDYAHSPDSLEKVLLTAKDFCRGRLIVVFGCGGDRDTGKRPIMGRIGSELADLCVITSDNPRTEDPDKIIAQILDGITPQNRTKCAVEPDRMKAIHLAIDKAQKDDLVLLAGKGHETYQILGARRIHFDDREIAQEALKEKGADHSRK